MKATPTTKISQQASRIAREYVRILETGGCPVRLSCIIDRNRFEILDLIGDDRLNSYKTLRQVELAAHAFIKRDLLNAPHLAQKLIDFRKDQDLRDIKTASDEQKSWRPLPRLSRVG